MSQRGSSGGAAEVRYCERTAQSCSHIRTIQLFDPPVEIAGCEECLQLGMQWVHLRMCQSCGHVGCCDNSQGKHATAHHAETGHAVIRSVEPGEDWSWCYEDELLFRLAR